MTYTTLKIKTATAILTATAALSISAPASAGSQDDVQSCRTAMASQSNIDMSAYRLRFESQKGYRARTIQLKAIPTHRGVKNGAKSFEFACYINQTGVVALNRKTKTTQFASAKSTK